nr:restriction endonuclease subunit S [Sphingomonas lycopersici]
MPERWATVSFAEVTPPDAPIIYGILQPGPDHPGGVPYVRPTEISDSTIDIDALRRTSTKIAEQYARSTLKTADTILTIVGTIGKVAEVPAELEGANITQSSCRIRADRALVEPAFVRRFLRSPSATAQYQAKRLGTAVPRLNIADIRQFELPLPPAPEQRRIVAKLDALTARLARARAELDRVPGLAAKLRRQVLVNAIEGGSINSGDFDGWTEHQRGALAVRREAYLRDRRGSRLRSDVGTELEFLNGRRAGWLDCRLADVISLRVGYAFKSKDFSKTEGIPLVRGANIAPGRLDWTEQARLPASIASDFEAYSLAAGDIVIAMDRPVISTGLKIAQLRPEDAGSLLVQRVANPRPTEWIDHEYLMVVLQSDLFMKQIEIHATGTDLPHISGNDILTTPCPLPPLDVQKEIVRSVRATFARADRLEAEAARTRALIDRLESAILAKAFRGELVPQDPNDEPTSVLLDRIRAERAAAPKAKRGRRAKADA